MDGTGWQHLVGIYRAASSLSSPNPAAGFLHVSPQTRRGEKGLVCLPSCTLGASNLRGWDGSYQRNNFSQGQSGSQDRSLVMPWRRLVAVRPHAFSVRTGSHRVCVQMGGLSLSLIPIHLSFSVPAFFSSSPFILLWLLSSPQYYLTACGWILAEKPVPLR